MNDCAIKPELLSAVLRLRPIMQQEDEVQKPCPAWWGDATHNLLLKSIGGQLSNDLHEENSLHPISVSTLYGKFPNRSIDPNGTYELRFTAANGNTAEALLNCISNGGSFAPGKQVELNYRDFLIENAVIDSSLHPWAASSDYQTLASSSFLGLVSAPERITLEFVSPTSFASTGKLSTNKQNIAYPLPDLVFGSLLERWNLFSPITLPKELRLYIQECLILTHFELHSKTIHIFDGAQMGMVGEATFKTRNYDRYWMSLINILADYAFFAGIGAKTAGGMGQVRRIYPAPRASEKN